MSRKLILFDIDGTMTQSPQGIKLDEVASLKAFTEVFSLEKGEKDISVHGKTEFQIVYEILATHFPKLTSSLMLTFGDRLDQLYSAWATALQELLVIHPLVIFGGVIDLLNQLQDWSATSEHEVVLGLLTGNSPDRAKVKLENVGLLQYFQKPDSDELEGVFGTETNSRELLVSRAQEKYGVLPEDIVIIDDSLIGAKMIQELNQLEKQVLGIMVATGAYSAQELQEITPHVFENMAGTNTQRIFDLIVSHTTH